MKSIHFLTALVISSSILFAACSSGEEKTEKTEEKKDTVVTDETEMPAIDEVEMSYQYEVTNTKTKKTVIMSQEEYLESGIWEKSEYVIKEIPVAQ